MSNLPPNSPAPGGDFVPYQTEEGRTRLEVRLQEETVWLSLNPLAELFQRGKSVFARHIKHLFDEGELQSEATVAKSATVQTEGGKQVARDILQHAGKIPHEQALRKPEFEFEKIHSTQLGEESQVEKDLDVAVTQLSRRAKPAPKKKT